MLFFVFRGTSSAIVEGHKPPETRSVAFIMAMLSKTSLIDAPTRAFCVAQEWKNHDFLQFTFSVQNAIFGFSLILCLLELLKNFKQADARRNTSLWSLEKNSAAAWRITRLFNWSYYFAQSLTFKEVFWPVGVRDNNKNISSAKHFIFVKPSLKHVLCD